MAAVNIADYSIATNGDIRYTGTTTNNTVIEFHRWLGDLMDDALATGNDLLDITDATASERSTDNIITLKSPFNIDDTVSRHLYDGSIIQSNGDVIYEGLLVFAVVGTPLQIIQNTKPAYPNFWGTGINADAANGISHRFMLKVRSAAADIDGRRLIGQTRAVGFTYSEFKINGTSRGNNVLALTYATDLNNATVEATIRGYTTVTNVEGYQLLDVNNDTTSEPYYSQWNRAALTINQFYERHKWLHRESTVESSCADSGSDFQVGNATVIGQSQSFANGVNNQYLTRLRVKMKKTGSPTGNITAKLYAHSGSFGSSSIPTGAALATSVNFDAATLTTVYLEYEIAFTTQYEMVASTNYTIAVEHAVIDGSNYIQVQGLASSGTHAGNRAQLVSSTWTPTAGDDLYFKVYASPKQYGISGEVFRGVTHEIPVGLAAQSATDFAAVEALSWTGGTGQLLAVNDVNAARQMWMQILTGVAPSAALVITGGASGATATTNANTIATTATAGTGSVITISFGAQAVTPYPAGTTFTVAGVTPTGYNGTYVSTGGSTTTVTAAGTTTGAQSVAGTVVGVIVERTLSQPPVGASTGSALIGSYGLGIETADLTSFDKLTDLTNTLRIPPNNVTFTVNGLVSAEDRVLVAPLGYEFAWDTEGGTPPFVRGETITFVTPSGTGYLSMIRDDGTTGRMQIRLLTGSVPVDNTTMTGGTSGATGIVNGAVVASEDPRQLKLNTTLSGASETAVVCTAAIPTDTPTKGTIRIQVNTGIFRQIAYSSYTSATFTLASATVTNIQIDVVATAGTFTRLSGSYITDGFLPGMSISMTGFANGGNNVTKVIASVTALVITVTNITGLVNETGTGDEDIASAAWDFSGDNATGGAAETGNSIFISYIDQLASATSALFTGVYLADRSLFIRVRDGASTPIKTFETTGTLGSAGGSATAIRTSDV